MPEAERNLCTIRWAVNKFKWWMLSSECIVYLEEMDLLKVYQQRDVHPRLRYVMMEL